MMKHDAVLIRFTRNSSEVIFLGFSTIVTITLNWSVVYTVVYDGKEYRSFPSICFLDICSNPECFLGETIQKIVDMALLREEISF